MRQMPKGEMRRMPKGMVAPNADCHSLRTYCFHDILQMTKAVLVLCQRKAGTNDMGLDIETVVVPKIEAFVTTCLGGNTHIEYLTDCGDVEGRAEVEGRAICAADYNFTLNADPTNNAAAEFVATHKKYYSLVILNTCPFAYMDFNLIHSLLKTGGFMAFTKFPKPFGQKQLGAALVRTLATLFNEVGVHFYKKKTKRSSTTQKGGKRIMKQKYKTFKCKTFKCKTFKCKTFKCKTFKCKTFKCKTFKKTFKKNL